MNTTGQKGLGGDGESVETYGGDRSARAVPGGRGISGATEVLIGPETLRAGGGDRAALAGTTVALLSVGPRAERGEQLRQKGAAT